MEIDNENFGSKNELFEIRNISDIRFDIKTINGDAFNVPAESSLLVTLNKNEEHEVIITNLFTGAKSNLRVKLNY